tara:strand:+ start:330 stop:524 length:195 start_codon:yes stop_codon:yes gene_type:complete
VKGPIYKQKEAILYLKLSFIQENIMEEGLCILLFTVTEDTFDEISEKFKGEMYFTRRPYGEKGN